MQESMESYWADSVFNNPLIERLSKADTKDGVKELKSQVVAFLERFANSAEMLKHKAAEKATVAFRGVFALIDPEPGRFGACSEDVDFLLPLSSKEKDSFRNTFKSAKAALRILTTRTEWKQRATEYRLKSNVTTERDVRQCIDKSITLMQGLPADSTDDDLKKLQLQKSALLEDFLKVCDRRGSLRDGAFDTLFKLITKLIEGEWASMRKRIVWQDTTKLTVMKSVLQICDDPVAKKLHGDVHDALMNITDQSKLAALVQAADAPMQSKEQVDFLLTALRSTVAIEMTPQLKNNLSTAHDFIIKFIAQQAMKEDTSDTKIIEVGVEAVEEFRGGPLGPDLLLYSSAEAWEHLKKSTTFLVAMRAAVGAFGALRAQSTDQKPVGTKELGAAVTNAVDSYVTLTTWAETRPDAGGPVGVWSAKVLEAAAAETAALASKVTDLGSWALDVCKGHATVAKDKLVPVSGGGSDGTFWYEGFTEGGDILEHFVQTLHKAPSAIVVLFST